MITKTTFKYWPRYISRLLRHEMEYRGELMGYHFTAPNYLMRRTTKKFQEEYEQKKYPVWNYSDMFPWDIANRCNNYVFHKEIFSIVYPDKHHTIAAPLRPLDLEGEIIHKGDRVMVLVGPDKGKIGVVVSFIPVRRLVIVEGLNRQFVAQKTGVTSNEMPLHMHTEVALIDPTDNDICEAEWRYDEEGKRVRISLRTGKEIPLSEMANELEDLVIPDSYPAGDKDTGPDKVNEVTFKPTPTSLCSFEADIDADLGIKSLHKRAPTYWY